ncbi:hypothetical protein BT96DRAFT_517067 [Gymnopus androsaceus JB14]|uniref:Uncharacterized protein n=1 Tax=Gymnopus androsaceus JB14 TaxID=1447944 RepID=A0A6A4I218_9AGAR|nr:hypothetical protein BT96DRAFT_517067 [Gymnopus androsaceus JB14]
MVEAVLVLPPSMAISALVTALNRIHTRYSLQSLPLRRPILPAQYSTQTIHPSLLLLDLPCRQKCATPKLSGVFAESTRAQAKSRRQPKDKGKSRKAVDADGDVDMEAAATLTSLLLHHRPSIAGSDTSEPGTHSARSSFAPIPPNPASNASTSYRSNTPPRSSNNTPAQQTTPRPAPTDNEAADLMLYLATSPSPARASGSKNSRDAAAFRALGNPNPVNNANNGNMMRAKPRVLFPTTQGEPNHDDSNPGSSRRGSRGSLGRNDSFAGSSMSSIGSDMGARTSDRNNPTSPQHLPSAIHAWSPSTSASFPTHSHSRPSTSLFLKFSI